MSGALMKPSIQTAYGVAQAKPPLPLTMSSKEIAELTEKQHGNVRRTIDTLAEKSLITFQIENKSEGRGRPEVIYHVNQRDSYVVVAQLSPEFTARLVDRWQEGAAGRCPAFELEQQTAALKQSGELCYQIMDRSTVLYKNTRAGCQPSGVRRFGLCEGTRSSMSTNSKQTSSRVASVAGKTLGSASASGLQKSLAGSALRQAGSSAQTGARTEDRASRALDNPRSSNVTRTLAGSVVSQSNKKR